MKKSKEEKLPARKRHVPIVGGPESKLPFFAESFLAWNLCISCLSVSGFHYIKNTFVLPFFTNLQSKIQRYKLIGRGKEGQKKEKVVQQNFVIDFDLPFFKAWIPLMTCSRSEIDRLTPMERYNQLLGILENVLFDHLKDNTTEEETFESLADLLSCNDDEDDDSPLNKKLLKLFRSNLLCRRLASLVMRPYQKIDSDKADSKSVDVGVMTKFSSLYVEHPDFPLLQRLAKLWPDLLELPTQRNIECDSNYEISLIIPAFNENGTFLKTQLGTLLDRCECPNKVEVIVVDAGGSATSPSGDSNVLKELQQSTFVQDKDVNITPKDNKLKWGSIRHVIFTGGGGRGPCLNFGASVAHGRILTFCHLDTKMPFQWDTKIKSTLRIEHAATTAKNDKETSSTKPCPNSCAFSFGIDTQGLLKGSTSKKGQLYYPPGIKAVETTANMRTQLYSLPYGDQALSLTKQVFNFVGGFPDQCLMEDYELVALLRKRAALIPKVGERCKREELRIIQGDAALCSPRRWQKFGVLYVTFMNSKFVNLYAGGMGPDDLYNLYYSSRPPKREHILSPWEIEFNEEIEKGNKKTQ